MPTLTSESASPTPALAPGRDLFVFLEVFENEGGIQVYNQNLLEAYLAAYPDPEGEVFVLRDGPDCPNPFRDRGLTFRYFKNSSPMLGRIDFSVQLLASLWRQRPRRVFCGHIKLAPLVRWLCQPLGIPYILITHGKEVWAALPESTRRAVAAADRVWIVSRYSRDRACEVNGFDRDRVRLLPCCVDGNTFTPGEKPLHLLDRYNLHGSKVLMTVARLWSGDIYKGVDITIRALPEILKHQPSVKYLAIGRGDDRPRLEKLARDLGVADRVAFAGFVPTPELPDHYRVADVYVMPSQEGFGIVYLEAMASGIPAIGGDDDGSADPLQDGRLGWRVPHRDPQAVAQACLEALSGRDRRCDGAWLRQEALAAFSKEALAQRLAELLADSPSP